MNLVWFHFFMMVKNHIQKKLDCITLKDGVEKITSQLLFSQDVPWLAYLSWCVEGHFHFCGMTCQLSILQRPLLCKLSTETSDKWFQHSRCRFGFTKCANKFSLDLEWVKQLTAWGHALCINVPNRNIIVNLVCWFISYPRQRRLIRRSLLKY